ncbi:MAG: preprotein translocase subunit SecE [Verrucomicrobiota bacterium]|nr:preprotein translocase subunit SecE [Verrucomicrobiota bacterium]
MAVAVTEKKRTSYLREVKQELKKVNWTSKEELLLGTKVVIGATFLLSFAIYGIDLLLRLFLNGFAGLFQRIFG